MAAPGSPFDQGEQPRQPVPGADVAPHVSPLLLAGAVHFLDVVEDLFDGRGVGHCFPSVDRTESGTGSGPHDTAELLVIAAYGG
ncbi:MAG: hypothetical protein KF861_03535 [Planctomycetaceae bacterium]|nr:hypothetical protein [Planctomycetaceae bacterium]